MAREIYNFIWAPPPAPLKSVYVAHIEHNTVSLPPPPATAVILFPSLLTPLVLFSGDQYFELLIATSVTDGDKFPYFVNQQLKISLGLDARKPYDPKPLFGGVDGKNIVVKRVGHLQDAGTEILKSSTTKGAPHKFEGILHAGAAKAMAAAGLNDVYAVRLDKSCLPVSAPSDSYLCSTTTDQEMDVGYTGDAHAQKSLPKQSGVVGRELSDQLIFKMLDQRLSGGKAGAIPGGCKYTFPLAGSSVDLTQADPAQPVQSYHPVILFTEDGAKPVSIGHFSDLHVNSRWQLIGTSPARVIEYDDKDPHQKESPPIGKMLAETNRSVHNVMKNVFTSDASLVVIGGDLIDHIRNAYNPRCFTRPQNNAKDVWNAVDLDSGYTDQGYPYGIDLVAFYSFILDAIRNYKKPAFGISGNHDCYVKPFGISPRLVTHRANEGIPDDLNLTFYEAVLAFGPTAGLLKTKINSSFESDWYEWFYMLFTPFSDWWHRFPKQSLVGLGWGDDEDVKGYPPYGDQGFGHLPRSPVGVSGLQLDMLNHAIDQDQGHSVTLTTHFTFLSYQENISMRTTAAPAGPGGPGGPPGPAPWASGQGSPTPGVLEYRCTNKFEFGTFQTNRSKVLDLLNAKKVQCVLTGHSHRRGTYLLVPGQEQNARMFDAGGPAAADYPALQISDAAKLTGAGTAPVIVVSDSSGPYPRYNGDGEFMGYGSNRPGGTLVTFGSDGCVATVSVVAAETRPAPRAAVALDYVDVMFGGDGKGVFVGNALEVRPLSGQLGTGAFDNGDSVYRIQVPLTQTVRDWKIRATKLVFAYQDEGGPGPSGPAGPSGPGSPAPQKKNAWVRVEAFREGDDDSDWVVPPGKSTDAFRRWLTAPQTGFVSMVFTTDDSTLADTYNWTDSWNFEAVPTMVVDPGFGGSTRTRITYSIARPSTNRLATTLSAWNPEFKEVPNFAWRAKTYPDKYGHPSP